MRWDSASPGVHPAGATAQGATLPPISRIRAATWPDTPRLGRFPKSGRDEARLEVLGPPFIPSLWPGWGQFSFRRPQRGRMKGDSSPSPSLPIPSRGPDCGAIELGSPPLLRPQRSPFRGGGQNAQAAERQGTYSWAAPPAASYEPAKPSIHSLRLALSLFSLSLFTLVQPFARAKLSSDFITRGLFSLQHNFEDQGSRRPTQAEGPQSLVRRSVLPREALTGRMYKIYWAKEHTRS